MQLFTRNLNNFAEFGNQINADLRRRAQINFQRQHAEKARLETVEEFEQHRARVRQHFFDAIGGLPGPSAPAQRSDLSARVTGRLERETFTVEELIYESLPNFPVTAALYLPHNLDKPAPTVIFVHGHSNDGKSYPVYQSVCIDLVNNGFVVLAIDPLGQGERSQIVRHGRRIIDACTYEHTQAGIPFWLRGASVARHFIWDVMRGVDYLETRDEVDNARIGITGCSGGGTQTCYLMMSEPRLAAAMPCTFVMTLETGQKSGMFQDAEQIIPGCMEHGPDHDDYLTAIAPRPVLVGAVAYDTFPIEGSREAVRRAKQIYALYGREENVGIVVTPNLHSYSPGLRQACVNWFKQHFRGEAPDFVTGKPETFADEELWATKSGQVYTDFPDALTVFDLNERELPAAPTDKTPDELREKLAQSLGIARVGERAASIDVRILEDKLIEGYETEKLWFFSALDIAVAGLLFHPRGIAPDVAAPATLLLLENGTAEIGAQMPLIESLLRDGKRVLVFDARGIGALNEFTDWPRSADECFNMEYKFGCDAMMLGLSTLGMRVFDALRAHDYLSSRADVSEVHLHGVGSGAVFAFFAAVLETQIASLTCEDMLRSYRELCQTPEFMRRLYNLKIMAYDLLSGGDFADYLPALEPRPVTWVRPRNALGECVEFGG